MRPEMKLLAEAADAAMFFRIIADEADCRNICGLPPAYTTLAAVRPHSDVLRQLPVGNQIEGPTAFRQAAGRFHELRQGAPQVHLRAVDAHKLQAVLRPRLGRQQVIKGEVEEQVVIRSSGLQVLLAGGQVMVERGQVAPERVGRGDVRGAQTGQGRDADCAANELCRGTEFDKRCNAFAPSVGLFVTARSYATARNSNGWAI